MFTENFGFFTGLELSTSTTIGKGRDDGKFKR